MQAYSCSQEATPNRPTKELGWPAAQLRPTAPSEFSYPRSVPRCDLYLIHIFLLVESPLVKVLQNRSLAYPVAIPYKMLNPSESVLLVASILQVVLLPLILSEVRRVIGKSPRFRVSVCAKWIYKVGRNDT
jgi:hypothetical protein